MIKRKIVEIQYCDNVIVALVLRSFSRIRAGIQIFGLF